MRLKVFYITTTDGIIFTFAFLVENDELLDLPMFVYEGEQIAGREELPA
jgi:hypothetical protein